MDMSNLPLAGGTILGIAVFIFFSMFVSGPWVIERQLEQSGWQQICHRQLTEEITSSAPQSSFVPEINCTSIFGMFGTEGHEYCQKYGDFKIPFMDQLQQFQRESQELDRRRQEFAVENSAYRCDCAVSLTLENQRIPFAIYAGSARLVTPSAVKNLSSELQTAMRSSYCAGKKS
ncbi:MAG: hypothetical protein ACSHXI_16470 [Hoeflea sp.]|uniref:hypothetical protein n=1 Tax=Hoeflea sp. TaxID=1940281 RepID=UPI003EF5E25B